jgi:hypothetical protein
LVWSKVARWAGWFAPARPFSLTVFNIDIMPPYCACGGSSASRPSNQTPFYFQNFLTRTVAFDLTGAQIATLAAAAGSSSNFPRAVKVAEIDLQSNAGLIGLSLSSTVTNFDVTATCAVLLGLDNGPVVNVDSLDRLFISHLSGVNSIPGLPASTSRTNALQMGQNSYYTVNSGQRIAIYAASPNNANNRLSGIATVFWIGI